MNSFFDKVKNLANEHDDKIDQALDKAGEVADDRTGHKYTEQIQKGVDVAKEHIGGGDTTKD
ncbi:antitoxin [Dactylosporangium sp. NPDC051484]|uniref:antitoxin n=1 Tax=Dactylosporangium sp. NPDC051484 TaxID=3154942 RepID=UPI00344F6C87